VDVAKYRWSYEQSPFGGEATSPNPTDRGKQGTKRSVLTEGHGIPLAVIVSGANRHDMKLFAETLDAVVIERPRPTEEAPQHLCGDKAYDFGAIHHEAERRGYIPHIRSRVEGQKAKRKDPNYRPQRWVVEVCHSWLNRFRKLLVRFEKKVVMHLGLLQFACAYLVFKRAGVFR